MEVVMMDADKRDCKIMLRFTEKEWLAINSVVVKEGNTIPTSCFLRALLLKIINARIAKESQGNSMGD